MVQKRWEQSEQYYQQSLQIKIEDQNRHAQAETYYQLGIIAQTRQQWEQAEKHFLEALRIFVEYSDMNSVGIVLIKNLAPRWLEKKDADLVEQAAAIVGTTQENIEDLFQKVSQFPPDQPKETGS
jgi:tetratricopeptide (TPR) repeat protein